MKENKIIDLLIKESYKAIKSNDIPVGAIIIKNDKIVAKAHNMREKTNDPLAHAEIICIKKVCKKLKTYNLMDCVMYVTLEPCNMCTEIINSCKLKKVVYLLKQSNKNNNYKSNIIQTNIRNNNIEHYKKNFKDFFKKLRNN